MRISDWSSDVCSSDLGWSLSSWESKDGRRYRFFVRRFDGSGQAETVRGEAELDADGSGTAVFHGPERREVALPAGTQFPTHHTRQVLNQAARSEEHTSELQSLMRISYAVFCLKNKKQHTTKQQDYSERAIIRT